MILLLQCFPNVKKYWDLCKYVLLRILIKMLTKPLDTLLMMFFSKNTVIHNKECLKAVR